MFDCTETTLGYTRVTLFNLYKTVRTHEPPFSLFVFTRFLSSLCLFFFRLLSSFKRNCGLVLPQKIIVFCSEKRPIFA